MKWWVFILLPFNLIAQSTYTTCENLNKSYEVEYDVDKVYYWSVSSGKIISDNGNYITVEWPDSIGVYNVSVYTTKFSCIGDTSTHSVTIEKCPYSQIFFPSSFTPNNDGLNDVYTIGGELAKDIKYLSLHDRWGGIIIETDKNIQWDGHNYPSGIYTLIVLVKNEKYVKTITLIR